MYIIISMILSGNILFLLFLILRKHFRGYFHYGLQNSLLKICLLFFILPLSLIFDAIDLLAFQLFGSVFVAPLRLEGKKPTIIFTSDGIVTNPALHIVLVIFMLWILLACVLLGYHLRSYLKFKKVTYASAKAVSACPLLDFLKEQAKALNIKRDIRLYQNNYLNCAYTMGIFRPAIILPANGSDAELQIIMLHELRHIKNHDTLARFVCLVCKGLYWFNPFVYLLEHALNQTAELACDEWVAQRLDDESKFLYTQLIIDMSRKETTPYRYSALLTENCKCLEERIDCIMRKPCKSPLHLVLSTTIAIAAVAFSSLPAFARPTPQFLSIDAVSSEAIAFDSNTDFSFYTGSAKLDPAHPYTIVYDNQFTSVDGTIYDADEAISQPRLNCDHVFEDGTYTRHERKSDGGCITKYFAAQRCRKCSHLNIKEATNVVTHRSCPH